MDAFEPEILKVMAELGNEIVNRIYEANVVELIAARAKPSSTSVERENWIRAKVSSNSLKMAQEGFKNISSVYFMLIFCRMIYYS